MLKDNIFEMKINYKILDANIDAYRYNHKGEYPNYIIMNRKTMYIMEQDLNSDRIIFMHNSYQEYHGISIAICDKLKDGEINIV